jgi:hypothetical protein
MMVMVMAMMVPALNPVKTQQNRLFNVQGVAPKASADSTSAHL